MPNVAVCCKWVLNESDLRIKDDGSIDKNLAQGKISNYDRNALQAAVNAAEALGGRAIAVTFADPQDKKLVKEILSRGVSELVWITGPAAQNAESRITAKALAEGMAQIDDLSLVICAEGSSDAFSRQTAPRLAHALNMPCTTAVESFSIQNGAIKAVRRLESSLETVVADLPAVVSVLPEAAEAPIPGLKAIIAAGKKPHTVSEAQTLPSPKCETLAEEGFSMTRKNIMFEGESAISDFIAALRTEGVI